MAARTLDPPARAALVALLERPKFELIPLRNAVDQAAFLPAGATVSVTASPGRGIEATIELCERLAGAGFQAVPHLAARMIADRRHLRTVLDRMTAAGVARAFVVGGDADRPGVFLDGLGLLRALAGLEHQLVEIGVPCYPQGHPDIPDERLLEALADKAPYVQYMTTQMCFDPGALGRWLALRRADGIRLPVQVGLPGVAELHRLMLISARIGVADSRRFLAKNGRLVGRLVRPGGYSPHRLLEDLAPTFADPAADVRGLHIYTFNEVQATEALRREYLAWLAA